MPATPAQKPVPPPIRYHYAENRASTTEQGFGYRVRVVVPDEATAQAVCDLLKTHFPDARSY